MYITPALSLSNIIIIIFTRFSVLTAFQNHRVKQIFNQYTQTTNG